MRSTWRPAKPSMNVRASSSTHSNRQKVEEGQMARTSRTKPRDTGGRPETRDQASPSPSPVEQEYKVGPGRPPREHQWKPGQSGNPKGAKRKQPPIHPDLKALFLRS